MKKVTSDRYKINYHIDMTGMVSGVLNIGLIGGVLTGSAVLLGVFYYHTQKKIEEKDARTETRMAEKDARTETRMAEKDAQMLAALAEKDAYMEARLDAKDARFEAFVERVLAATQQSSIA